MMEETLAYDSRDCSLPETLPDIAETILDEILQENGNTMEYETQAVEMGSSAVAAAAGTTSMQNDSPQMIMDSDDEHEHDWTIEDCIEFTQQWSSLEEMVQYRPSNIPDMQWKGLLDVYALCSQYGPDPKKILEQLEAREQEPGEIHEPCDEPSTGNTNTNVDPQLSTDDCMVVLRDCGFDDARAKLALQLANGKLDHALEIATNFNLHDRASQGEFGPAEVAVSVVQEEIQANLGSPTPQQVQEIIDEIQPSFDTQIDPELHHSMIDGCRDVIKDKSDKYNLPVNGVNVDTMETLTYDVEDQPQDFSHEAGGNMILLNPLHASSLLFPS